MLLMLAALFALQSVGANANAPGARDPAANPSGANAPSAPHARPASCAVVEIRSEGSRHDRYRFSATRILALDFETRLSERRAHEHTLRLRLYTPSGFLYQVLAVPVAADATAIGVSRPGCRWRGPRSWRAGSTAAGRSCRSSTTRASRAVPAVTS